MPFENATRSLGSSPPEGRAAEELASGTLVDGLYRVLRLLGQGGGGAVYLVAHEGLGGARYALKILREAPGRSFDALAREGRLAAQVQSAHVVKIASLGRLASSAPYLLIEFVEGPTLEALLADRDLVTAAALDCGRQLCLALEAVHARGLIHGDVSTRNLFASATPDGRLHLQLSDFGLARRVKKSDVGTLSVELGAGRGTPRFMAPEVISGQDEVDERSDLFSAGVVLYRLLSGSWPFDGGSTSEILGATLRGAPPPLGQRREGLAALEPVVMRCLQANPAARFQTARELREALEHAAGQKRPRTSPLRRSLARSRWPALGAVAASLVAVLAVFGHRAWQARAAIPLADALECRGAGDDQELARAAAQILCARVGAALDLDWGGGAGATLIEVRLRSQGGGLRIDASAEGRALAAAGPTTYAAALEAARALLARAARPPMTAAEIHRWGALDAESAAAARAVWRRRTTLILDEAEAEPRAALARDPKLPLMHLLLAQVSRDPERRREARAQALANADRLPPARAAALRGYLAASGAKLDAGLEELRRAYSESPDDVDIGVLYASALVEAARGETAPAVIEQLHARFPRSALLAVHLGGNLPEREASQGARFVQWVVETLPEDRGGSDNISLLTATGRLAEAEAASDYSHRLGVPDERLLIPDSLLALVTGDPARIERTSVRLQGTTRSWSQLVGVFMRVAALLMRGQVAAAESFLEAQVAARRSANDEPRALAFAAELLQLSRRAGGPTLPAKELAWMDAALARAPLPLPTFAFARTELALARDLPARDALRALDAALEKLAGADALLLAAARLRTLPLVRKADGDAAVAARWQAASAAWLGDRERGGLDAALSLQALGDAAEAERAYRLAMSPHELDRHTFESIAARLRLADLLDARGRAAEAGELRAFAARAWSGADRGLAQRMRR